MKAQPDVNWNPLQTEIDKVRAVLGGIQRRDPDLVIWPDDGGLSQSVPAALNPYFPPGWWFCAFVLSIPMGLLLAGYWVFG